MTSSHSDGSANLMQELYFQGLQKLGLLEALDRVPFDIQRRKNGYGPAQRCLTLLASQAQRCGRLTDWTRAQRADSRLQHWLGGHTAPHPSTLSRTLAACNEQTVKVLGREVLRPLTDQALFSPEAAGRWVFLDVDNKTLPAEGQEYEGTATGHASESGYCRGYRLHLISLANIWPLEMEFTGADAHALPSAMLMCKRLMHRVHGSLRDRMIVRGDSNHGSVRFIRFLRHYDVGYLLKTYSSDTARNLWQTHRDCAAQRITRPDKIDLLAIDLGPTRLSGMTRKQLRNGRELRRGCQATVPRVVVYHEDPRQVPQGRNPACFALLTTLPSHSFDAQELLEQAYLPRGGDIENIFCQLNQAFEITHLRSRCYYGNYVFLMLSLIAAALTQMMRQEAQAQGRPVPPGLKETLVAAANCGLRLEHSPEAGAVLVVGAGGAFSATFQKALRCSYQHRFRYAA